MSKALLKRIDELERKVRDLEARPITVPIIVQPYLPPAYTPYPVWPVYPTSSPNPPHWPTVTC